MISVEGIPLPRVHGAPEALPDPAGPPAAPPTRRAQLRQRSRSRPPSGALGEAEGRPGPARARWATRWLRFNFAFVSSESLPFRKVWPGGRGLGHPAGAVALGSSQESNPQLRSRATAPEGAPERWGPPIPGAQPSQEYAGPSKRQRPALGEAQEACPVSPRAGKNVTMGL